MNNNQKIGSLANDVREPRRWQKNAISHFFALLAKTFLLTATPGAGKTEVVCRIGRRLFLEGLIDRIVIVVPTEQLKRQWATVLARFGIDVDYTWENGKCRVADDYRGVVVTYQQVSCAPDLFDNHCREGKTLVAVDEKHHTGENLDWGEKLIAAFRNAAFILGLSGTPFRSDNNPIPFVRYENGKSCSDYSYTYGEALADGVCRPICFPTYEGKGRWIRRNGEEVAHSIIDELSQEKKAELLQVMLSPKGDWLPQVLREANDKLTEFRKAGHQDAGGLVFARDQQHAREIAEILRRLTKEDATVIISDEADAADRLREFARPGNPCRWIVAVRMVSEGIDIPRLRVGVFATNILSELFFRQAIGRLIRMIRGLEEQTAALYLPAHPVLIAYALAIREERDHVLGRDYYSRLQSPFSTALNGGTDGNESVTADDLETVDLFSEFGEFDVETFPDQQNEPLNPNEEIDYADGGMNASPTSPSSATNNSERNKASFSGAIFPISSEATAHDTIYDGARFTPDELSEAEEICRTAGMPLPAIQAAAIIRAFVSSRQFSGSGGNRESAAADDAIDSKFQIPSVPSVAGSFSARQASEGAAPLLAERKKKLRETSNLLINKFAYRLGVTPDVFHREWLEQMGGKSNDGATEVELSAKLEWVKKKIGDYNRRQTEQRSEGAVGKNYRSGRSSR